VPEVKEVKFGRKDEPAIKLRMSDDLLAVRTRSTRSLRAGPVASEAAAEVADGDLVLAFPEAGVEVYRVPTGAGRRCRRRPSRCPPGRRRRTRWWRSPPPA